MRVVTVVATLTVLACAGTTPQRAAASAEPRPLVLHVEGADGRVVQSVAADRAINPASLVKAATTLWALDRLGPDHRFETRFGYRGRFDRERGRIDGDLVVMGSGDPDFHVENAYLVASQLNLLGVREVRGALLVSDAFWLGWEGGSEKRERDPDRRATLMATRLRDALDPDRWSAATRRGIAEFEARRGLDPARPPRVVVHGAPGRDAADTPPSWLALHRSNPLVRILERFNAYSNNDIERLGVALGTADELAAWLTDRWGAAAGSIELATLSGLESNRLSPRQIVRLLRDLDAVCAHHGISLDDVLPVAGCDPGTLEHYPRLRDSLSGNLTAKTGTLNVTDGGVSVLAGVMDSAAGRRIFCVATPRAGGRLSGARRQQEQWVLDLVQSGGGAEPGNCGAAPSFSDTAVQIGAWPAAAAQTPTRVD